MNSSKSVLIYVSQLLILVCSLIATRLTLLVLGPAEYGIFGYALAYAGLYTGLSDLQLQNVFFKRIAEGQNVANQFSNFITIRFGLLSISVLAFLLSAIYSFRYTGTMDRVTFEISLFVLASLVCDVYANGLASILLAQRRAAESQVVAILVAVFNLAYIALFVYSTRNIYIFSLSLLARSLFSILVYRKYLKGEVSFFSFRLDKSIISDYWKFIFPLLPICVLGPFYEKLDALCVKQFMGFADTGYFVAAQKFNLLLLMPSSAVINLLYSSFSESAAAGDFRQIQRTSNTATKYISLFVTMLSIYIFFYTPEFIRLFLGNNYLGAVPVVRIFMVQVILLSVSRTIEWITMAIEHNVFVSLSGCCLYVIGIALNFVLIPKTLWGHQMMGLGAVGPAIKSLIIYILGIISNASYLYISLGIAIYWRFLIHMFAAVMAGATLFFFGPHLGSFIELVITFPIFCIVYITILIAMREITLGDWSYWLRILDLREALS